MVVAKDLEVKSAVFVLVTTMASGVILGYVPFPCGEGHPDLWAIHGVGRALLRFAARCAEQLRAAKPRRARCSGP